MHARDVHGRLEAVTAIALMRASGPQPQHGDAVSKWHWAGGRCAANCASQSVEHAIERQHLIKTWNSKTLRAPVFCIMHASICARRAPADTRRALPAPAHRSRRADAHRDQGWMREPVVARMHARDQAPMLWPTTLTPGRARKPLPRSTARFR